MFDRPESKTKTLKSGGALVGTRLDELSTQLAVVPPPVAEAALSAGFAAELGLGQCDAGSADRGERHFGRACQTRRCSALPALGVPVAYAKKCEALQRLQVLLARPNTGRTRWVAFLNANSFTWTRSDAAYREALFAADTVYPDGIALGIAAKLAGEGVCENLPGTDLVPELLHATADRSYRCYLLGGADHEVVRAAQHLEQRFPGWRVVGTSSGYFESDEAEQRAVRSIADASPDLLLVGMGTPLQERFVARHAAVLNARLAICVGGLFAYWSGQLVRAPRAVQSLRLEWLWILVQQPHKWRRYSIGIARFFATVIRLRFRSAAVARF